jgi:dTDP-4-amino-4,6-dideoxygalactose transaminase
MIQVTKPFLPPFEEYTKILEKIWKTNILTNMGPISKNLENELKSHLSVKNLHFVSNGTIALQLAIKALDLKGEIITTPFSYVATSSSIVWENCKPIFVDIDNKSLNIDPDLIEEKINKNTQAILATHVFGNPCNIDVINEIAKKNNLKVIYDGAHAFGVKYKNQSIFNFGDISTCSLHATKLFNSGEGGLVISNSLKFHKKIEYMKNFGHKGPEEYSGLGINGKNSEFHAALGLINLSYITKIHNKRKLLSETYDRLVSLKKPLWNLSGTKNYSYYPVIFSSEKELLMVQRKLEKNNIFGRRYFYPSLNTCLNYVENHFMKNSENISKRVFCLPIYYDLEIDVVRRICSIINKEINK